MSISLPTTASLALAFILLVTLATQYPLQTTFPIGGDAADYITTAQHILDPAPTDLASRLHPLTVTTYPLFHLAFLPSSLLSTTWPDRFVWWMTAGHVLVGLALAALMYRIDGLPAAAAALAIWALATTGVNTHFEDGTLAQLWSLIPLALFFERIAAATPRRSLIALGAAILTHPVTGLLASATLAVTVPPLLILHRHYRPPQRRLIFYLTTVSILLAILAAKILMSQQSAFQHVALDDEPVSIVNLTRSHLGPFLLIAPVGAFILASRLRRNPLTTTMLTSVIALSILLTFNQYLGISLWTFRFQTYLIFSLTILAALAIPRLIRLLAPPSLRWLPLGIMFGAAAIGAWQHNQAVYAAYESPSRYLRLHPTEQAGIDWITHHTPPDSHFISSATTRHAEWIPVLTDRQWHATGTMNSFIEERLAKNLPRENEINEYLVLFNFVEEVPEVIANNPDQFPIVFQNKGVTIFRFISSHE